MPSVPNCTQPLEAVELEQSDALVCGRTAIQLMFQFQPVALLGVRPGQYTYVRKPVALIEYSADPPSLSQVREPARLLEMIGALVKPHPDKSMSR